MSKILSNIICLCLISLGMAVAFLLDYLSGWLSGVSFFQTLIVAFILGLIEIFCVHKLADIIPTYYSLDDDRAFPFIAIGVAATMLILKN